MAATTKREELHRLLDCLPEVGLETVEQVLKGIIALHGEQVIPLTPEEKEEFAFWEDASNRTWERVEKELELSGEEDTHS